MAGKAPRRLRSISCCAATPSMSSTAPWRDTRASASPICRTSHPTRGGEMATPTKTGEKVQDKVDVVIAGAGASGSVFAAVLAKAGKKVVLVDNGPDWQLTDLISSDMWGRASSLLGRPSFSKASRWHRSAIMAAG